MSLPDSIPHIGIAGLSAAKTFLEIDPDVDLVVIDRNATVGGVWASERLYPGLKTNSLLGTYEFPDFPMQDDRVKDGEHIPGEVVHGYLEAYAKRFDVMKRVRFNTIVTTIERLDDGGWLIHLTQGQYLKCDKLMMATGVTSDPLMPKIRGSESFDAPLIHTCDLGTRGSKLAEGAKKVVVLGSGKSAYDAVYLFASRGVKVEWASDALPKSID